MKRSPQPGLSKMDPPISVILRAVPSCLLKGSLQDASKFPCMYLLLFFPQGWASLPAVVVGYLGDLKGDWALLHSFG